MAEFILPAGGEKAFAAVAFVLYVIVDFFEFVPGLCPDAAGAEIGFDLVVMAEWFDVCDLVAG